MTQTVNELRLTDDGSFPPTIVARRIGLVELETKVAVPSSKQEGGSERSQATILCVGLLIIAH